MTEPEIAFADLADDMDLAEDMIKYIINYCLDNAPEEMTFFNQFIDKGLLDRLNNVVSNEFARASAYGEFIACKEDAGYGCVLPDQLTCDRRSAGTVRLCQQGTHNGRCP